MRRMLVGALSLLAAPLPAQSLLNRSPNLSGTWVPEPGVLQFDFLHRFHVGASNALHKVRNTPMFTFALGLPARTALGIHYATNSITAPAKPNEFELYGRWQMTSPERSRLVVALTPAYNAASSSFDGELSADYTAGSLTLSGAVRAMSQPYDSNKARAALAAGVAVRLNAYVALTGDVASLMSPSPLEKPAWGAGFLFQIPNSPHLFSLHVSNVDVNTIEGASRRGFFRGGSNLLYGFEFTIPLHLSRFGAWFRKSPRAAPVTGDVDAQVAATLTITAMKFPADTVVISAGQAVRWNNTDPLGHTISFTAGSGEANSELIPQNGAYVHRFNRPGTYAYYCTPHPFMKGVVVVQ
ncbi:MAG TPA: plastocyanin/azurin family copper-binding protein [Gemmatimonadales bacterium]